MAIITLTTDFGSHDGFPAAMKGVILSIAPAATIVDTCHEITPFEILDGALVLEEVCPFFPRGTIHVAVVDPGVGSSRAALAIETERYYFVGPDNGLFDLILKREPPRRVVQLTNARYHRQPVSTTFHGRDIFAPVAAHLAAGVALEELGPAFNYIPQLNAPAPIVTSAGLEAHVLRMDRFGNLVLDLSDEAYRAWNPQNAPVALQLGAHLIHGIQRTFSDVAEGDPVAYFGSAGRLEIAVRNGRADKMLNAQRTMKILLSRKN